MQAYWGYCEQERGTYLEIRKWEEISTQIRLMNMISDSLTSCTDSNFVSCLLFLAFNVLVLMYLIEQVERGAGTSGKTEKIQVTNKHRRVKEETDSNDSEFWMLKSSSGSESEQESDEENCKGTSFCFFLLVLLSSFYRNLN